MKDVIEKLAKEVGPVGEELRKILERSIDEIHETLKKDGVTDGRRSKGDSKSRTTKCERDLKREARSTKSFAAP